MLGKEVSHIARTVYEVTKEYNNASEALLDCYNLSGFMPTQVTIADVEDVSSPCSVVWVRDSKVEDIDASFAKFQAEATSLYNQSQALSPVISSEIPLPKETRQKPVKESRKSFHKGSNNPAARLTDIQVKEMREMYTTGISVTEIARAYRVSYSHTLNIVHYKAWKD